MRRIYAVFHAPNKSVASRDTRDGIQHDLRALAGQKRPDELRLAVVAQTEDRVAEDRDEIRVGGLGREVAYENAILLRVLILNASVHRAKAVSDGRSRGHAGGPVHNERLGGVGHGDGPASAVIVDLGEHARCVRGGREGEEAVAGIVGLLAGRGVRLRVRDLDVDWIPAHEIADLLGVFFVHPGLEISPNQS